MIRSKKLAKYARFVSFTLKEVINNMTNEFWNAVKQRNVTAGTIALLNILSGKRFSLSNEKKLQSDIENCLVSCKIPYNREVKLSPESIIDFKIDVIGIEVKITGSAKDIHRQLVRYTQFNEIETIILITSKTIQLPSLINNKPTYILNLGRAWL
jgi:hypothetical protein